MTNGEIFCDKFYQWRERLVREQIGEELDKLKPEIKQLYSPCMSRLMNAQTQKELTLNELLALPPNQRQAIVSTILYNDALWRIEAAYLMLCIGMLNVVYSNLRTCLENVVKAHIVENLDSEAQRLLKGDD